jgi:hypothetical protein
MADFLVTIDGKYLYYGLVRYFDAPELFEELIDFFADYLGIDVEFDHNDFKTIFVNESGRVQVFNKYMAVYSSKTGKHDGYMKIEKFYENAIISKNQYVSHQSGEDLRYYRKFTGTIISTVPLIDTVNPKEGDRIILVKRRIFEDQGIAKIETIQKSFTYPNASHSLFKLIANGLDYKVENKVNVSTHIFTNDSFFSQLPNFISQPFTTDLGIFISNSQHLSPHYNFYSYYSYVSYNKILRPGDTIPSDLSSTEKEYVETITLLFHHLFVLTEFVEKLNEYNYYFLFERYFEIFNFIAADNPVISSDDYYESFGGNYFHIFYLRLHEFYLWAKGGLVFFEYDMLTRIVGLFDSNVLKHLDYTKKTELLKLILFDNWFVTGRWNPFLSENKLTEEEVIVKIIQSIRKEDSNGNLNYDNINDFMDKLNSPPFYEPTTNSTTLFQVLYSKVDDDVFFGDDGNGAKGQMIKAIYSLWVDSKYNPSNPVILENQKIITNYTSYNALWKFDDPIEADVIDYNAKPLILNYESDKILLWYNDNFEFPFYQNKIIAAREEWQNIPEMMLQTMQNLISPFQNFDYTKYVPFGFYNIFDPIVLRHTDSSDSIIKIPLSVESLTNPCALDDSKNKNEIPIFYLKYVNDLQNYSNFKETFGVALDVVLTFTGVGNITKIRYLTKASIIRRYLSPTLRAALSTAERQLINRTIRQVAFASWEVVLGTAGILHSMTTNSCQNYNDPCNPPQPGTPQYEQFQDCQAIQGWLIALEIFTLSGDLLAKRYFRRKSYELRLRISEQKINDFPNSQIDNDVNVTKAEANNFLDSLAEIEQHYLTFFNNLPQSVKNKLNALNLPEDKRYAFMFDFESNPSALADFASDPNLIDDWVEVSELLYKRKSIKFLKSYRAIKSNADLLTHVHLGHPRIKRKWRSGVIKPSKGAITGSHNLSALRNPPPPPLLPGEMSWQIPPPVQNSIPLNPSLGYQQGTVQRNMHDLTDPATNTNFVNSTGNISIKEGNVYFPESYSTSRINEEIAHAHSQIDLNIPFDIKIAPNGSHSFFFRGKASDGHTIEMIYNSPNSSINSATLKTAYPLKF